MVVEPFQIIALTLFLLSLGSFYGRLVVLIVVRWDLLAPRRFLKKHKMLSIKWSTKYLNVKPAALRKNDIIYRKDPLSASPKPDDNGFYKALSGSRKPGSVWWRSEKKDDQK